MEWISVKDKLPQMGECILCSNEKDQWTDFAEINHNGFGIIVFWNRECIIHPTHWAPLPKPPKK